VNNSSSTNGYFYFGNSTLPCVIDQGSSAFARRIFDPLACAILQLPCICQAVSPYKFSVAEPEATATTSLCFANVFNQKGRRLGKPPVRFFLLGRHPQQRFFEDLSLGRKLVSAHSLESICMQSYQQDHAETGRSIPLYESR